MFDTMTGVKIVGGFCGSLLVFLLALWAAESIYHVGAPDHGGEVHQAYTIPVEDGAAEEEQAEEVPFEEVFAAADPGAGERLFRQCASCHRLEEGANATGPHLHNIVGREIASVAGFNYSDALASKEGDWTPEALSAFIEDPSGWAPGTNMTYNGMDGVEDRANLIAYLQSVGG